MNFHIYVANPRFEDDPIAKGDWVAALEKVASKNEKLVIERKTNKRSGEVYLWGRLRESKYQRIDLNLYGLIHAQNPSRALIEVMFEIATELGLKVYSERSKPYQSPDDWEKRTRKFRKKGGSSQISETQNGSNASMGRAIRWIDNIYRFFRVERMN